eukprot:s170_g17.t1
MMMLLAARELRFVLRGFLVLPSYMLLCGAARLPGTSLAEQRAHLREAHRLYNFVMDSVQAALLEGVFCPGIGRNALGSIFLDAATTTLQTHISRLFALTPLDSQPLAFTRQVQECNGSVMAAWHCYNDDTPTWLSLSSMLTDERTRVRFAYFCTPPGRRFFVAYILIETLRFALVFQHDPTAVIDLD